MIQFKVIPTIDALKTIYSDRNGWPFLYDFVDLSGEVEMIDDEIYLFDNSGDHNYINTDESFWVAGYDNGKLCFLQLVHRTDKHEYDLVAAEKHRHSHVNGVFQKLIRYITNTYDRNWECITTFPINGRLKKYYIMNGFSESGKELKLTAKS